MSARRLDPGAFTARLVLEAPVATPDGQGGAEIAHAAVASVWTRIEPLRASVAEAAGAEAATITHRVWLRYRTDVTGGMRLRKGARVLAIRAWRDPDETRRYLVCDCEETAR